MTGLGFVCACIFCHVNTHIGRWASNLTHVYIICPIQSHTYTKYQVPTYLAGHTRNDRHTHKHRLLDHPPLPHKAVLYGHPACPAFMRGQLHRVMVHVTRNAQYAHVLPLRLCASVRMRIFQCTIVWEYAFSSVRMSIYREVTFVFITHG